MGSHNSWPPAALVSALVGAPHSKKPGHVPASQLIPCCRSVMLLCSSTDGFVLNSGFS